MSVTDIRKVKMRAKPVVHKRVKGKPIPKGYGYCRNGCEKFTLSKDMGMCSSDCACDKLKCLNCGKISYVEYD